MAILLIVVGALFIVLECSKRILRLAEENPNKKDDDNDDDDYG